MTRRFRLDSATAGEVYWKAHHLWRSDDYGQRAQRLYLHWWALGHDPARALRCPECEGDGKHEGWDDVRCPHCSGRGWSMPHERGTRG